jgi:putative ABC transport system substrate-binding protein
LCLLRCSRPEKEKAVGLKTLRLVVTLALVILTAPLVAHAQPSTIVHRIGRLVSGFPPSEPSQGMSAVQQGLRALGYVEGQNLVIEHRYAEGRPERLPALAAELVQLQVSIGKIKPLFM